MAVSTFTVAPGVTLSTVPTQTQKVIGNGTNTTIDLGAYQYSWWYKIVRNIDGSITITDIHGGSLTNSLFVGVTVLKFADGLYDVATGTFLNATQSAALASTWVIDSTAEARLGVANLASVEIFKTGSTVMKVASGIAAMIGNGAQETADFGRYSKSSYFQITHNLDGTLNITDIRGGSVKNALFVGISYVRFGDAVYDVASQTFAATSSATNWTADAATMIDPTKVVRFGAGATLAAVPAGTKLVIGTSGSETADLTADGPASNMQITRNSDGTISITDTVGGTLRDTLFVGVSTLKFGYTQYDVASGTFRAPLADMDPAHKVVFGPGETYATLPAGTKGVVGADGQDTVDFGPYAYLSYYQITRNSDGSVVVTDTHGGSITNAIFVGVNTFRFAGQLYDVATGTILSTAEAATIAAGWVSGVHASDKLAVASPDHVLTIPDGITTEILPLGTQVVIGNASAETVDFGPGAYAANFQIIRNIDGSVSVTDTHGSLINDAVFVDVSKLRFTDKVYDVATNTFTDIPVSSGSGSSYVIDRAPDLPDAVAANDIVSVRLTNDGEGNAGARTVTFGQVFAKGDLPAGSHLVATVNGQTVQVQIDAKTHHADGSVNTAEITLTAPALSNGASMDVMLARAAGAAEAATALSPQGFVAAGYDAKLTLAIHNADGSTTARTIDAAQALTQALAAGTAKTWLSGALATEVQVNVAINSSLHVLLNIRGNADGTFATDIQALNDGIFSADMRSYSYDMTVTSHGQTLFSEANVDHGPYQEWHKSVWSNAQGGTSAPGQNVVFDVGYLQRTGVISDYDLSTGVARGLVNADQTILDSSDTSLLGSAAVVQYQPQTGARPDIGITTQWSVNWLMSQSSQAERIMLANADAAGSRPTHIANADGTMVTVDSNPSLWLDYRNVGTPAPTLGFATVSSATGWTLDTAHMADLAFIPALTQGSQYYISQLQAQANYDLLAYNPTYRGGSQGLGDYDQVRGIAWLIRDLANAAYATPEGDPLKAYYTQKLENNIQDLLTDYVGTAKGAAQGQLQGYVFSDHATQVSPWHQQMLAIAMGHAADLGFAGAKEFLAWQNNFISGLFTHGESGFDPLAGTTGWLNIAAPDADVSRFNQFSSTGNGVALFTTWGQVYSSTYAGQDPLTALAEYPNSPAGYAAIAKAALAVAWNHTHSADDLAAYAFVTQNSPGLVSSSGYVANSTWNITPVLSDGHQLRNSEVYYGNGGVTTSGTANALMAATNGNNTLIAGTGADIMIGGRGSDILKGLGGDDHLFAGTGGTRLEGGTGTNYLKGGSGNDTFAFETAASAHDTVVNFKPGFDTLEITTGGASMSALDIITHATTAGDGSAILHLSADHDVLLQGVATSSLDTHWFHIV